MENVAAHLAREASQQHSECDKDAFGRSAFNRYYYAAYLVIRSGLGSLSGHWAELPHKDIPEVLKGEVTKSLKRGLRDAHKLSDREVVSLCASALDAAGELATLTTRAYGARVTADYFPDIRVNFGPKGVFSLNAIEVAEAKTWPHKARALVPMIVSAWRQI